MEATIIAAIVSAAVVVASWFWNHIVQTNSDLRKWKEERYKELLFNLQGFYDNSRDAMREEAFIATYRECWLFASDSVIRSLHSVLESLKAESTDSNEERKEKVGNCVMAMRRDLFKRTYLRQEKTDLEGKDFKHVRANIR